MSMTFRSLICEESEDKRGKLQSYVSLGRVSFWIFLIIMCYFWCKDKAVPDTLYNSWIAVLLYNFSKKICVLAYEKMVTTIKE